MSSKKKTVTDLIKEICEANGFEFLPAFETNGNSYIGFKTNMDVFDTKVKILEQVVEKKQKDPKAYSLSYSDLNKLALIRTGYLDGSNVLYFSELKSNN